MENIQYISVFHMIQNVHLNSQKKSIQDLMLNHMTQINMPSIGYRIFNNQQFWPWCNVPDSNVEAELKGQE